MSIGAGTLWAIVLAVSGTFEQLLTYVVFVGWIFYALGAACVFVLRRTQPDADRPFRVPGYPWTPMLFIVAAAALVGNTIATQPVRAAVGIGVVLLGLPVYFIWRQSEKTNLKSDWSVVSGFSRTSVRLKADTTDVETAHAGVMSVRAKSSPTKSRESCATCATAYARQSPKFSDAACRRRPNRRNAAVAACHSRSPNGTIVTPSS